MSKSGGSPYLSHSVLSYLNAALKDGNADIVLRYVRQDPARFANETNVRQLFDKLSDTDPNKLEYLRICAGSESPSTPSPHSASAKK